MRTRIPLPDPNNDPFKDAFDYFETIQKRKAAERESQNTLAEKQKEFAMTHALEQQKLSEISAYHKAKLETMLNGGVKKLTAQERNQAMKLLDAGRSLQSIGSKGSKLKNLLDEDKNLTGWVPGAKAWVGKGGEKLNEFTNTAGEAQAAMGRLASTRGGAQVLKWADRYKASNWKDHDANRGMVKGMYESAKSDYDEAKAEYEDLTGKPYPIKFPEVSFESGGGFAPSSSNPPGTTVMHKGGEEYHIPDDKVAAAKLAGYQ